MDCNGDLIVALFVPGYQLRYQMKTEKGTFKDIPATMTSELKQMKEAAKLNFSSARALPR